MLRSEEAHTLGHTPLRRASLEPGRAGVGGAPGQLRHRGTAHRLWWRDWALVTCSLLALWGTEYATPSRHMYITDTMLDQIKFPFQANTVPSWAVPLYSLVLSPALTATHAWLTGRPAHFQHGAVLSAIAAVTSSALVTNVFKVEVGRPRPDFYYRCWPDGLEEWEEGAVRGQRHPVCHPLAARDVVDGYKSFPSGHTSWSMAAMLHLSLYLLCFFRRSGGAAGLAEAAATALPTLFACWVGATRVVDYYHNPSDVAAGAAIGAVAALACFCTTFPPQGGWAWGTPARLASGGVMEPVADPPGPLQTSAQLADMV